MNFRKPFPDKVERLPGDDFKCVGPSLTKQADAEACDINLIVAKYHKTGHLEHVREHMGAFEFLPDQMEYQEALAAVSAADMAFAAIPAEIRAQFSNSAALFLQFAEQNPGDYLEKLGLVPPAEIQPAPAEEQKPAAQSPAEGK